MKKSGWPWVLDEAEPPRQTIPFQSILANADETKIACVCGYVPGFPLGSMVLATHFRDDGAGGLLYGIVPYHPDKAQRETEPRCWVHPQALTQKGIF